MRKILNVIFLCILLTSSCCCGNVEIKQLEAKDGVYLGLEKIALPGPEGVEDAFTIKMERFMLYGHDYIVFYHGYDSVNNISLDDDAWIHDPNCRKCNEKHSESPLSNYQSMFDW